MKALYFITGFASGFVVGSLAMKGYLNKEVCELTDQINRSKMECDKKSYDDISKPYRSESKEYHEIGKAVSDGIKEAMEELDDPDLNKFMAEREHPKDDPAIYMIDEEIFDHCPEDYEQMFFTFSTDRRALFDEDFEELNAREYLDYYLDILVKYQKPNTIYLCNEKKKIYMSIEVYDEEERWETL